MWDRQAAKLELGGVEAPPKLSLPIAVLPFQNMVRAGLGIDTPPFGGGRLSGNWLLRLRSSRSRQTGKRFWTSLRKRTPGSASLRIRRGPVEGQRCGETHNEAAAHLCRTDGTKAVISAQTGDA
jgi:hypothetical protein